MSYALKLWRLWSVFQLLIFCITFLEIEKEKIYIYIFVLFLLFIYETSWAWVSLQSSYFKTWQTAEGVVSTILSLLWHVPQHCCWGCCHWLLHLPFIGSENIQSLPKWEAVHPGKSHVLVSLQLNIIHQVSGKEALANETDSLNCRVEAQSPLISQESLCCIITNSLYY